MTDKAERRAIQACSDLEEAKDAIDSVDNEAAPSDAVSNQQSDVTLEGRLVHERGRQQPQPYLANRFRTGGE